MLPGSSKSKSGQGASMMERVAEVRAITVSFMSENCLPLSLAVDLLNYIKCVSEDTVALKKATISRRSATYKST